MRSLFPFLKPYRKECVLAPLFKLLEAVLELFVPLIMAAIIDNGIQARDTGYVLRMGLGLVGLGLLGLVSSVTAQFFARRRWGLPRSSKALSFGTSRGCPTPSWIPWAPLRSSTA